MYTDVSYVFAVQVLLSFRHPPPSRAIKILVNAIFMGLVTFIFYCYCYLNEQSWKREANLLECVRFFGVIKDHDTNIYLCSTNLPSLSHVSE